jgi:hypothetical protein
MLRKTRLFVALVALALPVVAVAGPGHDHGTPWFDMENCAFCKHLVQDPELLDHVTWESYKIHNGAVTLSMVEPAYVKPYAEAMAAMEALGAKMESGGVNPMTVKMCGHCMAYGELMMAGAEIETVGSDELQVHLMTSSDPEVVAKIHEFTQRNIDEMTKMAAAETQ